jgi:hypothetical protein
MHGTEDCRQASRAVICLLPRYRLSAERDQCLQIRLLVLPVRSRSLVTAFHYPETTVRSSNHRSDVNAPGLLLQDHAESSSSPLTFCSTAFSGFDPVTSDFTAKTRCLNTIQHSRSLFVPSLPIGAFVPLRIKALARFGPGENIATQASTGVVTVLMSPRRTPRNRLLPRSA